MPETIPPPKPEAKPSTPPPKEALKPKKPAKAPEGTARATLERIAGGTPVLEATAAPESLPSRETVDAILTEGNKILLELKDMRLLVNAIATQAADTPLGNEIRLDALRSLLTVNAKELEPLQEKIHALNLPEPKTRGESALLQLEIPEEVKNQIRTQGAGSAETVSHMLQTNDDQAALVWKEITGQDGFTRLTPTPDRMLDLAGIEKTPENRKKATDMFGVIKTMKEPPANLKEQLFTGAMYGALALMFFSQIALGEGGGGQH